MNRPIWERIDPRQHADGVYYVPAAIEVQPRLPHWGHPERPGVRELVDGDRPHGIGGKKLLCLLCMRIRAEQNLPVEPVWLTFISNHPRPHFRHEDGRSPHIEHQPETDIHKAIKEREARTFEAAGAISVEVEAWRPRARRRPDVTAVGPALTVAAEAQHSAADIRKIQARQRALRAAGDRVVWTTDLPAADIDFMHLVPHLAVPTVKDYRFYLHEPQVTISAGVTLFEHQRCGWTDLWNGNSTRCPVTRRVTSCGGWHLYPSLNRTAYQRRPIDPGARFPYGPRPHLDHMLEGILHGKWLPYRRSNRVTWIPSDVYDAVEAERGGDLTRAETAPTRAGSQAAARACEERLGLAVPAPRRPGPVTSLNWSKNAAGDPRACWICRKPALMRDDAGRPCHKVCAESQLTHDSEGDRA
ncbi:competence protein CoiA family protein [Micromonospora costi]|uniref:competence protein CoiA family protein n=1 Tax=Micromonospora costi TaxID=1530042 RepID=UPI0033FB1394